MLELEISHSLPALSSFISDTSSRSDWENKLNLPEWGLYKYIPLLVPIHKVPFRSSYRHRIKSLPMLVASSGLCRKILKLYPSNLFSPLMVPNHKNPFLS